MVATSEYYSGQGKVFVAERDVAGNHLGFTWIGNASALELAIEITKFEHKESFSGQRAVDLTVVQEKNGTFTLTAESLDFETLALAAWGDSATVAGAAVAAEVIFLYKGYRTPGDIPNWDSGVPPTLVKTGSGSHATWAATTAYVEGDIVEPTVPDGYYYRIEAGNDGTSDATEPTWVTTVGATTADATATWTNIGLTTLVLATDFTVDYKFGAVEIASAAKITDGESYDLGYTHLGTNKVEAFTKTSQERWLRFEGLNTIVDEKRVVIDIYKASLDPLASLPLINEEVAQMEITGNMLLDDTKSAANSQLFRKHIYTPPA